MAVLAVVLGLVVGVVAAPAPVAAADPAYVRGMVVCQSGQAVRGVSVQTARSGTLTASVQRGPAGHVAYYAVAIATSAFPQSLRLNVTCGLLTASSPWRKLDRVEPGLTSTRSVLNVFCGTGSTTCRFPLAGADRSQRMTTNWFPKYQCTYGAAVKFMSATTYTQSAASIGATTTGYLPRVSGDAREWNDVAAAGGWDVVSKNPAPRSLVIFEPGVAGAGARGHNGFVTAVDVQADGVWVTYVDMNGAGGDGTDPTFATRRTRHVAGMSYILVPVPGWNA